MKPKLLAIAAAIALLTSSATALADPPPYMDMNLDGIGAGWWNCQWRGSWPAGVEHDPLPTGPGLVWIAFDSGQVDFLHGGEAVANAYACVQLTK